MWHLIVYACVQPLSFIGVWKAFAPNHQEQPLWTMRKSCCSVGPKIQIFLPSNEEQKVPDYTIKGNWLCRKSTIFFRDQIAAEVHWHKIKPDTIELIRSESQNRWLYCRSSLAWWVWCMQVVRDASLLNVLISKSIFHVTVQPGVDTAFIFSLIVIMDKLYIHNAKHGGGGGGGDGA